MTALSLKSRAYFDVQLSNLSHHSNDAILGALTRSSLFAVEDTQRQAWLFEIAHLRKLADELPEAHAFLEFGIPRVGKRADVVLLERGNVFVLEYKVGAKAVDTAALVQATSYALDLLNFHEGSHDRRIVPVVIATQSVSFSRPTPSWPAGVTEPQSINGNDLSLLISSVPALSDLDPETWANSRYKPTPTIIEAAQALYRGHGVEAISRSEAGAENLTATSSYIGSVIERSKQLGRKAICFVTGVPGSGKTLAGLNIANERMKAHDDEHAVFLSGNGPLVDVLREALARDAFSHVSHGSRDDEKRRASTFIQNIHHFRDDNLRSEVPPVERVVVFDEAQRAWTSAQASKFMVSKRGLSDFSMSEPEFLLSVMDRHTDWCTVICLVGGGQEINTGEAGITEWLRALANMFPHWDVHISSEISRGELADPAEFRRLLGRDGVSIAPKLHLAVSIRSFRAEALSEFVGSLIDGDLSECRSLLPRLANFPIHVTRDLSRARGWLRAKRRGLERAGILASSNALRLKPHGIFVRAGVDAPLWFLAPSEDVRSSDALEDVATEFEVQGLELDWTCVCWDANFRREREEWVPMSFRGTAWQKVADEQRIRFIANAYRVLLTRARQGMIIFVPEGDESDPTRSRDLYDPIFEFLTSIGLPPLE